MRTVNYKTQPNFYVCKRATLLYAQSGTEKFSFDPNVVGLDATQQIEFEAALRRQNFKQAETILMNEINKNPKYCCCWKNVSERCRDIFSR